MLLVLLVLRAFSERGVETVAGRDSDGDGDGSGDCERRASKSGSDQSTRSKRMRI
jgi:hypothetical protein